MTEIWKDIQGYEGIYKVSNLGNVKSCFREGTKGGLLKKVERNHYFRARLWKNGKVKTIGIHRLVAQAFIPNVDNKPCINHKDGNKQNNVVTNLEWVTYSENALHSYSNSFRKTRPVVQLKNGEVVEIYLNAHRASKETGIDYCGLYLCLKGVYKNAGGYEWKYGDDDIDL